MRLLAQFPPGELDEQALQAWLRQRRFLHVTAGGRHDREDRGQFFRRSLHRESQRTVVGRNDIRPERFEDAALSDRERAFLERVRPAFTGVLEAEEQTLYVGGTAGVLDEFRTDELRTYRRLLEVLEQRAAVLDLLRASLGSKRPFVRVGPDLDDPDLAGVSLVGAAYGLQHMNLGTVSLLGPTRMDYEKAIAVVRAAAHELSRFVEELYES